MIRKHPNKHPANYVAQDLPETLWTDCPLRRRSEELSTLYVRRYSGPRTVRKMTRHAFWEIGYVLSGGGELHCQHVHKLCRHTAFLIPPNMDHYEHSLESMDTLWVAMRGTRLTELSTDNPVIDVCPQLAKAFEDLWLTAERADAGCGVEMDALTTFILTRFLRLTQDSTAASAGCIDDAIGWLNRHFDQPITIAAVAGRFGCSEGYFYRTFRKQTGQTPVAYLTSIRMQHAIEAMRRTTLTIDRIARSVGYRDGLYFSRIFSKATGVSPTEYRRQIGDDLL